MAMLELFVYEDWYSRREWAVLVEPPPYGKRYVIYCLGRGFLGTGAGDKSIPEPISSSSAPRSQPLQIGAGAELLETGAGG